MLNMRSAGSCCTYAGRLRRVGDLGIGGLGARCGLSRSCVSRCRTFSCYSKSGCTIEDSIYSQGGVRRRQGEGTRSPPIKDIIRTRLFQSVFWYRYTSIQKDVTSLRPKIAMQKQKSRESICSPRLQNSRPCSSSHPSRADLMCLSTAFVVLFFLFRLNSFAQMLLFFLCICDVSEDMHLLPVTKSLLPRRLQSILRRRKELERLQ